MICRKFYLFLKLDVTNSQAYLFDSPVSPILRSWVSLRICFSRVRVLVADCGYSCLSCAIPRSPLSVCRDSSCLYDSWSRLFINGNNGQGLLCHAEADKEKGKGSLDFSSPKRLDTLVLVYIFTYHLIDGKILVQFRLSSKRYTQNSSWRPSFHAYILVPEKINPHFHLSHFFYIILFFRSF